MDEVVAVSELKEAGLCPICFRPIDSDIYPHDACEIFCGIKKDDDRFLLSRDRLNSYKGDWMEPAKVTLLSAFVPWDIEETSLPQWFSHIEGMMVCLENQRSNLDVTVKKIIGHLWKHLYTLPRVAFEQKYSDISRVFSSWDVKRPTHPLDHFSLVLQSKRLDEAIETKMRDPWEILSEVARMIPGYMDSLSVWGHWNTVSRIGRELGEWEEYNQRFTTRTFHDKALVSSFFDLKGCWSGWIAKTGQAFTPAEADYVLPEGLRFPSRVHIPWEDVIGPKNREEDLRNILSAMGKELLGTANRKKTDSRAPGNYAEIVDKGAGGLFESIEPTTEFDRKVSLGFVDSVDDGASYDEGLGLIKRFTRFDAPTCPEQAEAIGFIARNKNALAQVIMPTGFGKSLIPLAVAGKLFIESGEEKPLVLVVCPLIALLEDQVKNAQRDTGLKEFSQDGNQIACLHSRKESGKFENVMQSVKEGSCSLLYLTADQLQSEQVLRCICARSVAWMFIDEGHGIVEFVDYRPAYYRIWYPIMRIKKTSPDMGLEIQTATLPKHWGKDMWMRALRTDKLPRIKEITSPRIRENLSLEEVREVDGHAKRNKVSVEKALEEATAGNRTILYSLYLMTDDFFEDMYNQILDGAEGKFNVGCYSSAYVKIGRERADPDEFVKRFSAGELQLVLATMAFGMGIDRSDVKAIVFNGIPLSLNTLYQQAGRAGRAIDNKGRYIYNGKIFIYYSMNEDVHHQRHLGSFSELYGNTVTKFLANMLMSKRSAALTSGLMLLDLWADYPYLDKEAKRDPRKVNIDVLKILEKLEIIDWLATLPTTIGSSPRGRGLDDASEESSGWISTPSYLRERLGSSERVNSIYEVIDSIADTDARWGRSGGYALIAWKRRVTRDDIQMEVASWKGERRLEFDSEFPQVLEFIHANQLQRKRILKEYYGLSGK